MNYYAHSKENMDKTEWQLLKDHLLQTANLAKEMASDHFKEMCYYAGLLHDYGKYSIAFQKRISGNTAIHVEHSIYGAKFFTNEEFNNYWSRIIFEYIISGHHSGIPDYGTKVDSDANSTLCGRLKRETEQINVNELNDFVYNKEIIHCLDNFQKYFIQNEELKADDIVIHEKFLFVVRYFFSILTDSDYLDTETFMMGQKRKALYVDFNECLKIIKNKILSFQDNSKVNHARKLLREQAEKNINCDHPIYLLNMPTGSGKTLCSMELALIRLIKDAKKRIIYVIPYMSIIEQTSQIFRDLFPNVEILEHQSNFDFEKDDINEDDELQANNVLKKASENWDAPIIVTTNVQFFESIYSNKSSRLRKLHNMENSIIIFDEIHMMPIKYFEPCMSAIQQLTKYYGCESIFLTATMPDFQKISLEITKKDIQMFDLIPNKSCFKDFYNCDFVNLDEREYEEIIYQALQFNNSLVIVNSKKAAVEMFNKIEESYNKKGCNKYYLTTNLTPDDRQEIFKEIKNKLKGKEQTIVVATSLIEAGVDLDFDAVFRELCGLDSLIQSSGRCNREGLNENCNTFIFKSPNKLQGAIMAKQQISSSIINEFGINNIRSPSCIDKYFMDLYLYNQVIIDKNALSNYFYNLKRPYYFKFETYAEDFHLIENSTISILIPSEKTEEYIKKLENGECVPKRKVSKYCASITEYSAKKLLEQGIIRYVNGFYCLENKSYYNEKIGLDVNNEENYIVTKES